ncbi:MAG: magnesium transporter CorA family protein [Elusimicrobia bacterium]|nr:magnesium transporter CorA family protein [Elusimicrobiota bacterium]
MEAGPRGRGRTAHTEMIRRYSLDAGKVLETPSGGPIIAYVAPDEAERKELIEKHGIDPHNLDSALDPDEIGRIEVESDHLAIILKRPRNYCSADNFLFRVISMGVFLYADKMVIVLADDVMIFEGKHAIQLRTLHDVLIKLLYSTIHHFNGHLKVISMLSDELEHKINTSMENKYLLCMFTLEKSLVYFLNAVNSNTAQIEKLKHNAPKYGFSQENVELLDDISLDNQQCLTLVQTYSNILSSLMDARASVVSNNLNVLMKNLTAISIGVMVPTFFASVGGMSEFTMMTHQRHWPLAYALFTLAMAVIGVATYVIIDRWMQHRAE